MAISSIIWSKIANNLNFCRVLLLYFTIAPLISSAIFYAANGATHVSYIDSLYICFSATTVCGLITVDISALTGFQQALVLFFTSVGHQTVISWVMVYIRRRFFDDHLHFIVESEMAKRRAGEAALEEGKGGMLHRVGRVVRRRTFPLRARSGPKEGDKSEDEDKTGQQGLSTTDATGPEATKRHSSAPSRLSQAGPSASPEVEQVRLMGDSHVSIPTNEEHMSSLDTRKVEPRKPADEMTREHLNDSHRKLALNRSRSCGYDNGEGTPPEAIPFRRHTTFISSYRGSSGQESLPSLDAKWKSRGFGGFPYPTTLLFLFIKAAYVNIRKRSQKIEAFLLRMKPKERFFDPLQVFTGRNSKFYGLTAEDLAELGGVEYRALNALLWIVAIYHFVTQIIAFIVIVPYMSLPRWSSTLSPPEIHQVVPPAWFSVFQVVSAYSTSGMSLVDQSMVPFQTAYPLILVVTYLVMAGNLAYPCFLRFFIWSIMKLSPSMRLKETLQFLLDHPRRCYLYLFPSHQTWILLLIVVMWNAVNYLLFLTLNIGAETFEEIPLGVRFAIGVLQATSIRAAGFGTTALSSLSPAMLVYCLFVMYLGIFPITMSIRATNVYEERSLGVFDDDEDENSKKPAKNAETISAYGTFVMWHARKQLSFDIWWLAVVAFVISIIERNKLQDDENHEWFTNFHLLFETVSAYTGVGISLGFPDGNYAFSGALSTPSKLILAVVMVRGRQREMPVAIDRAVMLPYEFERASLQLTEFQEDDGGNRGEIGREKDAERQGDSDRQENAS